MLTSWMCGIFGCKPAIDDWLKRSTVKQHSRGPDQSSEFIVRNIGLAVNRNNYIYIFQKILLTLKSKR